MRLSLKDYEALKEADIVKFIKLFIRQDKRHAPLFPAISTISYAIFGIDRFTPYITNSIFLFILLLSVFYISEGLIGFKGAILSIFFIATFPAIIAYQRDYLYEFPLAALTALSYLFFLKSDLFKKKYFSVLFGITVGISVLIKTMGIVFL